MSIRACENKSKGSKPHFPSRSLSFFFRHSLIPSSPPLIHNRTSFFSLSLSSPLLPFTISSHTHSHFRLSYSLEINSALTALTALNLQPTTIWRQHAQALSATTTLSRPTPTWASRSSTASASSGLTSMSLSAPCSSAAS